VGCSLGAGIGLKSGCVERSTAAPVQGSDGADDPTDLKIGHNSVLDSHTGRRLGYWKAEIPVIRSPMTSLWMSLVPS
jgi:hypothetical protein